MEKSFTRTFYIIVTICAVFLTGSSAYATKMARISIDNFLSMAHFVAVVNIESTQLTGKTKQQVHTTIPLPIIKHKVKVIKKIKGQSNDMDISFLNTKGLSAGNKYIVFLVKDKNDNLQVMVNGYGAMRISYISMSQGIVEAVRIPESYIELPKAIKYEVGSSAKGEQASYVWSELSHISNYLQKKLTDN